MPHEGELRKLVNAGEKEFFVRRKNVDMASRGAHVFLGACRIWLLRVLCNSLRSKVVFGEYLFYIFLNRPVSLIVFDSEDFSSLRDCKIIGHTILQCQNVVAGNWRTSSTVK